MSKKMNRRQFLGSSLGSMAYLAAMSSPLGLLRKVGASSHTKRYLINIQGQGGWDSQWFHHTYPASSVNFPQNSPDPSVASATNSVANSSGIVTNITENFFHRRFPDSELLQHPNRSDVYMGMGMKYVFSNNMDLIKDNIAIWRGIQAPEGHGVSNHIIQGGSVSSYALSFAAIIAQGIADQDYQRALHYVQLTPNADAFASTWALNTGAAVAINLPDYNAFNALTAPNANEFSVASQRTLINNAVAQLSTISANRLKMKTSQQVYNSFLNGFNSAAGLASTNIAQSNRFYYLWRNYTDAICTKVYGLYDASFKNNCLPITGPDGTTYAALNLDAVAAKNNLDSIRGAGYDWTESSPYSSFADAKSKEGVDQPWLTNFKMMLGNGLGWWQVIINTAYNYAMAEFLVREDLSAVVDVPTSTTDAHDFSNDHLVRLTVTFTAYKTLLANLKSTGLLDSTTVAMWTELDRTPNWQISNDSYNRGTGHNPTTSVLLAGYGVAGGKVVGDNMTGPGGAYNWQVTNGKWVHDFSTIQYSSALPIDINTGLASHSASAVIPTNRCVLPTMCSIFGISVPLQQVNDGIAIPAVKKSA